MENKLILTEDLKQQLQGAPGVLFYSTELRPELIERIKSIEVKLLEVKAVTDQASADAANAVLKEAKGLVKTVEAEALDARRPFNEIAAQIKSAETKALSNISTMVSRWNSALTEFAKEQERKRLEREAQIRREAEEKAKAETDRVNSIISLKNKFYADAIRTINGIQTVEEAEQKKNNLVNLKFSESAYQEYLPQMEELRPELLERIEAKRLSIVNQIEIDTKAQQEELERIQAEGEAEKTHATMNVLANTEMEASLKTSLVEGAKSVQKRWKLKGVLDITKVPIEYLQVNEKAVSEAIKNGNYSIPGLIIEQEISNVSR